MEDQTISITRPSTSANTVSKQDTTYPTEWVDLPSQGYFYAVDNPLSSGKVELKQMTAKEEDILTNVNFIKSGVVLDRLLESLLIDKRIKTSDFLVGDKNALLVAIRRLAYGDSYGPIQVKCNSCRKDNNITVNLGEVKMKEYNFTGWTQNVNLFSYELPFSKNTVVFKFLTSKDELDIECELKASSKLKIATSEFTTRLRQTIVSINGNDSKEYIRKAVDEMLSKDCLALRTYMKKITPNIDLSFNFSCEGCQSEERIGVPITAQFFWPDA